MHLTCTNATILFLVSFSFLTFLDLHIKKVTTNKKEFDPLYWATGMHPHTRTHTHTHQSLLSSHAMHPISNVTGNIYVCMYVCTSFT